MPVRKRPKFIAGEKNSTGKRKVNVEVIPVTLQLPKAHPAQHDFISYFDTHPGCRFVFAAAGTKFGKTFGCAGRLILESWNNKGTLNWWVAPTFGQSKNAYYLVKRMLPKGSYVEFKADLRLVLLEPDGSEHSVIEFKSADNDDSLRGFAVNFFILDEAARVKHEAYVSIMTTVTQTQGRGIVVSTPKGQGWFYDEYQKGVKFEKDGTPRFDDVYNPDPNKDYFSICMPTWANPYVPIESIVQAKKNLPRDTFMQEFAAQFIEDSAGVFRSINQCIKGNGLEYGPLLSHRYVAGVDLARLHDYTVITVMDADRKHVVYTERFNQLDWEVQYSRIINVVKRFNATCCIDWTGIGDPIVETLRNAGLNIEPYKISTGASKQQLIEKLRVNIENGAISFPKTKETMPMIEELRAFEYTFSKSGNILYSAPSGKHDDCVVSLALANWIGDVQPFVYRCWNQRGV